MIKTRLKELIAIKEREGGRRLTYRLLSDELGISKTTITNWAKGDLRDFNGEVLEKFCDYFGVDIGDVLIRS